MADVIRLSSDQEAILRENPNGVVDISKEQRVAILDSKTWRDAFGDVAENPAHYVPYLNAIPDVSNAYKSFSAASAVRNGTATPEQEEYLNSFLADRQRDQTFGYKAWNLALNAVPYALEFLIGGKAIKAGAKKTLIGGLKAGSMSDDAIELLMKNISSGSASRIALQSALKTVPKDSLGLRVAAYLAEDQTGRFGINAARWGAARMVGTATPRMLDAVKLSAGHAFTRMGVEAGIRTALQPHRVADQILQNMSPQYALTEDQQGELKRVLVDEGDDFLPAFAKAFGDVSIENFSEQVGESFLVLKGMFGPSAKQFVKAAGIKAYADKAIASMAAKGIPVDQASAIVSKHLFGAGPRDPGMLRKLGFNGILSEMGEEGIGGLLRQATGLSEPGLPSLEDVGAMAVGFALNPMAIGSYVAESGAKQYAERMSGLHNALNKAKSPEGDIRSFADIEDLRKELEKMIEYKQTENPGMFQRFARAMVLDRVWDAQADLLRKEGGVEAMVENEEGKAVLRRIEWEMDAILSRKEKMTTDDVNKMIEQMLSVRIMDQSDVDRYGDQVQGKAKKGDVLLQYGDMAPFFAVKKGTLAPEEMEYLTQRYPWIYETVGVNETPTSHLVMAEAEDFPTVTEGNAIYLADLLGVPSVRVENVGKGAGLVVKTRKQLVQEVNRRVNFYKQLHANLPEGTSIHLSPFFVVQDSVSNFRLAGQSVDDSKADEQGQVSYAAQAMYSPTGKAVYIHRFTPESGVVEDAIESLLHEEDGTIPIEVIDAGSQIKAALPDNARVQAMSPLELVSKALSVQLGYKPTSKGDLKQIIVDNQISLPSEVLSWARKRSKDATTNAEGGDLFAFLEEQGGGSLDVPIGRQAEEGASEAVESVEVQSKAKAKVEQSKERRAAKTKAEAISEPEMSEVAQEEAPVEALEEVSVPEGQEPVPALEEQLPPPSDEEGVPEGEEVPLPTEEDAPVSTEQIISIANDEGVELSEDEVAMFEKLLQKEHIRARVDPEDHKDDSSHTFSLEHFEVFKADDDAGGHKFDSEKRFESLVDEFAGVRKVLDTIDPEVSDLGHWMLYRYARGEKQNSQKQENFLKLMERFLPEKMQRSKAVYRSIYPLSFRQATFSWSGFNWWFSNRFSDANGRPGPIRWHFYDTKGNGRPGYMGDNHVIRTLSKRGFNFEIMEGVKDDRNFDQFSPDEVSDELWKEIKDNLYRKSYGIDTKEASRSNGYWHIMSKIGDKNTTYAVWMKKYQTLEEKKKYHKLYTDYYNSMDPAVARKFIMHPDQLAKKTGRDFADAVNHARLMKELVGDLAAFESIDDLGKRLSQAGTPGIRLHTDGPVRYAVFNDQDLFDGMAFYDPETFGKSVDDYLGAKDSNVIKMFGYFRNNDGKGSVHSYKPLAVNINELDSYPRYQGIYEWMKRNNIDLLIPSSSVKLGKKNTVSDPVKFTELMNVDGQDVSFSFDTSAEAMEMSSEDIIISGDYNYDSTPDVRRFLDQLESVIVHYNGTPLQSWRSMMNQLADSRSNAAKNLTLQDVVPFDDEPENDDPTIYGRIQEALRNGVPDAHILAGPEGDLALRLLTSEANQKLSEPVTRLLRSAVAPGDRSGTDYGDRKPVRMSEDGQHLIPADLDANVEGGVYTEDNAKNYWHESKEELLDYMVRNAQEMYKEMPWMYELNPVTGKPDFDNPVVRDWLVVEWEKNGATGYTPSGELVIASRVPLSFISFAVPSILHRRIGDGTSSMAMSDSITQSAKGEDNDADQVYIDLIPRRAGTNSLAHRSHMLLLQAMMIQSPARLQYMTEAIDLSLLDDYIPEAESVPPFNTDEGQSYLKAHTSEWNYALGIAASTAPTLRFANELGVTMKTTVVVNDADGIIVSRTQEEIDDLTEEGKLIQDFVWGNFLINFYVDAPKHGKLAASGHNRYTVPLLYAMAAGSIRIQDQQELIDYAGRATVWLRENEAVQSYIELKREGKTNTQIFGTKDIAPMITGDADSIDAVRRLVNISSDMYEMSRYFKLSSSWPGYPVGYLRGKQYVKHIEEGTLKNFDTIPLANSEFHHRTRTKAKALDELWADSLFSNPAFEFDEGTIGEHSVRRTRALLALEGVALYAPNDYSREATADRLRAAKEAHKDNAFMKALEISKKTKRFKGEVKSFDYSYAVLGNEYRGNRSLIPREDLQAAFKELPTEVKADLFAMNAITMSTPYLTSGSSWGGDYGSVIDMETYKAISAKMWEANEAMADGILVDESMVAFAKGKIYEGDRDGWFDHVPASVEDVSSDFSSIEVEKTVEEVTPEQFQTFSLTYFNAASQEGMKRGLATFNTKAEAQKFAGEYSRYWKPVMEGLRDATDPDAYIKRNFVPYPEGNYPRRMSPTPGLISKAHYLADREKAQRITGEYNDSESQLTFGYSLEALHDDQIRYHPQYVTTGWKALHREWQRVRNLMRSERIYGRITAERLMRLAGGVQDIGYGIRKIEGGANAGLYRLVNFDAKDEKAPLGFREEGKPMPFGEANALLREKNKGIRKPSEAAQQKAAEILKAVTAVKEDPKATVYFSGFVLNKDGRPIMDRHYVIDRSNNMFRIIGDLNGYDDEFAADEYRQSLAGNPNRFSIMRGYRVRYGSVKEQVDAVGQDRFDEMLKLAQDAMVRARGMANMAARDVLDGQDMIAEFGANEKTYMPHIYIRKEREEDENEKPLFEDEDTKRGRRRVYPRFIDAAALRALEPVGGGAASNLIDNWYGDVWHRTVNRVAVSLGSTAVDFDGAPMWIPRFHVNEESRKFVSAMTDTQKVKALEHAVDYINMLRANREQSPFVIDKTADPVDEMERLFGESTELLKKEGYEPVAANRTSSVAEWWVKKSDGQGEFMLEARLGGGAYRMLMKLEQTPDKAIVMGKDIYKGIERFNAWSKFAGLSLSAFHPASLIESMIAFGGFTLKNIQRLGMPVRTFRDIQLQLKLAKSNPYTGAKWAAKGMMLDVTNPNIARVLRPGQTDTDVISRDIERMKEIPGLKKVAPYVDSYHKWINAWLWSTFYPAIKLYSAEQALDAIRHDHEQRGVDFDEDSVMREISKMMNDGFGGQNWDQYIWSTPRMMQLLHMGIFAPDWTLSAFNIAGGSNVPILKNMIRENQGAVQKDWAIRKYWPGMVMFVMLGIPQAVQASIYALSRIIPGDDDEEDTPFIALNEAGKRGIAGIGGHIDITPILRPFGWVPGVGYEGGRTGQRRVYMRFAKQATEVFEGWATRPWQTFLNKTSASARTAYEQITGTNTAGWEMGFKGRGLSGVVTGEEGVLDSRIVTVAKKFVPMSILSVLEGRPSTFFAPASRGMSFYTAQLEYAKVLKAYGDRKTMDRVNKSDKYKANLKALDNGILDAARRNGINPEDVVAGAKRHVLSGYYGDFFDALNKQKLNKLESIAEHIVRVNGSAEGAMRSMQHRFKGYRKEFSEDLKDRTREAFQ